MIAMSLCRTCYTVYLGRKVITVAQPKYMRDIQYVARSKNKMMSNTMFVEKVVEANRNLQKKKEDRLMGQKGSVYVHKAVPQHKKERI